MIRRKEMPPPLVLKAVTTQTSATLNKKTLTSKGTEGPVPWINSDCSQDECGSSSQNG